MHVLLKWWAVIQHAKEKSTFSPFEEEFYRLRHIFIFQIKSNIELYVADFIWQMKWARQARRADVFSSLCRVTLTTIQIDDFTWYRVFLQEYLIICAFLRRKTLHYNDRFQLYIDIHLCVANNRVNSKKIKQTKTKNKNKK